MEHLAELVTAVLASRRASPADDSFMSNADALGAEHERDVIAKSGVYYYYYYYYSLSRTSLVRMWGNTP